MSTGSAVAGGCRRAGLAIALLLCAPTLAADPHEPLRLDEGGRALLVHVPARLPAAGTRALVVVLHGGLGNAERIATRRSESGLNLDAVADRDGFVVAYPDGTPVTRNLGPRFLGWNAGGCCGVPAEIGVDDVAWLGGAIDDLVKRYGIDRARVYAIGHSNGAMMAQRLACETRLLAAVVAVSGPLMTTTTACPASTGRRLLAIHGADDRNVPVAGGVGPKGLSHVDFRAEADAKRAFESAGATYTLQIVPDADHGLDRIDAAIVKTEGVTLAEKAARFFGITPP